ncbi:MAG: hypothetical protein SNH01_07495 [Rikenellaceae bacterium]
MKKLRVFFVAVVALLSVACEEVEWTTDSPTYVPVYVISDIKDTEGLLELASIDIYQEKPIMIQHTDKDVLVKYDMIDYIDATDSDAYDISFKVEESDSSTGELTMSKSYSIYGTKMMGFVYLKIKDNLSDSDDLYFDSDADIAIDKRLN